MLVSQKRLILKHLLTFHDELRSSGTRAQELAEVSHLVEVLSVMTKTWKDVLGKRVRRRREELGMLQKELAAKTGFTEDVISKIERGVRKNLRPDNLVKLAQALGVSVRGLKSPPRTKRPQPTPEVSSCPSSAATVA